VTFLATGDNHGMSEGYGAITGAVNIDLGNFISVEVDAANSLMTIGGASNFSRFFDQLYEVGKVVRK
jgi:fumiquinazoline A oxidase